MTDMAMYTNRGGRDKNEDYILSAAHNAQNCYILCDGLGGHECGEVASMSVAKHVASLFEEKGDSRDFIKNAFNSAQENLLDLQKKKNMVGEMKTTMVVLVVTEEHIKWGHIGDSRLYHIYNHGFNYERTKDHSLVQLLADMGEVKEQDIRKHPDRNKLLRAMGAPWNGKSFDLIAILERETEQAFALMSDGFWEYVYEEEMLELYRDTKNAQDWLEKMKAVVEKRADMTCTDNYSCICVRVR